LSNCGLRLPFAAALREEGSPEPPAGFTPATLELKQPVNVIGRRSEPRAIFPEIDMSHDDAVSHRHALLQLYASGVLLLRDIGSSNGTRLNGKLINPMIDQRLKDGDEITLGHWSKIRVTAIGATAVSGIGDRTKMQRQKRIPCGNDKQECMRIRS